MYVMHMYYVGVYWIFILKNMYTKQDTCLQNEINTPTTSAKWPIFNIYLLQNIPLSKFSYLCYMYLNSNLLEESCWALTTSLVSETFQIKDIPSIHLEIIQKSTF